jgi:hypothetical protein
MSNYLCWSLCSINREIRALLRSSTSQGRVKIACDLSERTYALTDAVRTFAYGRRVLLASLCSRGKMICRYAVWGGSADRQVPTDCYEHCGEGAVQQNGN